MQGREVAHSEWELVTSVVQSSYSECYNFLMKHKLSELPLKVCILSLRGFESRQTAILTGANLQSISNIASAESFNSKVKGLRAQVHGVNDLPYFMFRCAKIFGEVAQGYPRIFPPAPKSDGEE